MTQSTKRIVGEYLVTCARLGDRAAQEQLVSRYQKSFLRHAYRLLGEAEQARDAVQDGWFEICADYRISKMTGHFKPGLFASSPGSVRSILLA